MCGGGGELAGYGGRTQSRGGWSCSSVLLPHPSPPFSLLPPHPLTVSASLPLTSSPLSPSLPHSLSPLLLNPHPLTPSPLSPFLTPSHHIPHPQGKGGALPLSHDCPHTLPFHTLTPHQRHVAAAIPARTTKKAVVT